MRRSLAIAIAVAFVAIWGCSAFREDAAPDDGGDAGDAGGDSLVASDGSLDGSPEGALGDAASDSGEPCTNTQTQTNHCGKCGHSCLGGDCVAGKCQPLVLVSAEPNVVAGIAVDATHVYWTRNASSNGAVMRVPKDSPGTPPLIFEGAQEGPRAISFWRGYVYWTTDGVGGDGGVNVEATDKSGGIGTSGVAEDHPTAIAVKTQDAGIVVVGWTLAPAGANGRVRLSTMGFGVTIDKVSSVTNPTTIAFDPNDDTWIYYASQLTDGFVRRANLPNPGNETVLDSTPNIRALAILGARIYWTADDGLHSISTQGDFATAKYATVDPAAHAFGLVADLKANALYYVAGDGFVYRSDGVAAGTQVARGPLSPRLLAQDDDALYWVAPGMSGDEIWKVAKPPN